MNKVVISASNLTKTFSGKEVIRNCTLSVQQGSIYGFLGHQIISAALTFLPIIEIILGTTGILAALAIKNMLGQVKNMEV